MTIGAGAVDLLLRLIEADSDNFRKDALDAMDAGSATELIEAGILVADGLDFSIASPSGVFVVGYDERRQQYGFHDPEEGWISVEKADIVLYRLNVRALAIALLGDDLRMTSAHPIAIDGQALFEIGSYPFLVGTATPVWLMRRLTTAEYARDLQEAAERRPSSSIRVVLTPSAHERIVPNNVSGLHLVSFGDVLRAGSPPLIDVEIVRLRLLGGAPAVATQVVSLSEDNGFLVVNGAEFRFRGEIMRKAIRLLYEAYRDNKPIKLEHLLDKSGSASRDLDALFGDQWVRLKKHVHSDRGYYTLTAG